MARIFKSLYDWCIDNNKQNLIDEFMEEKNGLSSKDISYASNKKYWWKCEKGHQWLVSSYHRVSGNGCPICSNKKLLVGYNDLQTMNPKVASEWHPTKNGNLKPCDVIYKTTKKIWWKCNDCGNEWMTAVRNRINRSSGCPTCALIKIGKEKSKNALKNKGGIKNKTLIEEWDYKKNYPLTPNDITEGSNKIVFWKCKENHSWQAKIVNRKNGRGCPYCGNRKLLVGFNDFATIHPELLEEWDYDKNADLKPENVMSGSRTKVWWKCKFGHSYQADLNHRTSPIATGCPICYSGRQTSFAEQAVYYYIKQVFSDSVNRYLHAFGSKFELDIYIPSIRTAIEYDGEAWHKNDKLEREIRKYKLCKENNIKLIRLRERPYETSVETADYWISYKNLYEYKNLKHAIINLLNYLLLNPRQLPIEIDIEKDKNKIHENIYKVEEESLEKIYPEIAKEWHPTKNGESKPNKFKPRSDFKAWWLCSKCGYEWITTIGHRVEGTSCPRCGIKKSTKAKCKKVAKCDLKSKEIIEVYDSISDAGRKNKISTGNIASVCTGKRPSASGYFWKYYKED